MLAFGSAWVRGVHMCFGALRSSRRGNCRSILMSHQLDLSILSPTSRCLRIGAHTKRSGSRWWSVHLHTSRSELQQYSSRTQVYSDQHLLFTALMSCDRGCYGDQARRSERGRSRSYYSRGTTMILPYPAHDLQLHLADMRATGRATESW